MPLTDIRSIHFPYCLQRQADGSYVVLNREYKPLGFKTNAHIDYAGYPIAVKLKRMTAKTAKKLSCDGSANLTSIYLYNDGCVPTRSRKNMQQYLARLEILAKLKVG
jgi:hypothetical protein